MKEKLAKAVAEAETVDVRRADEYTLGTWLQTWYELYAKPHLRFSTAEYYRRGIELHITPRIGDIPLKKLTGRDLQWLYKDLQEHGRLREAQKNKQPGLSDSTIRGIHTMLHSALDRAVKERLIVRNPADDCVPPKNPKHEMRILPPEQIKSYLTAAEQRGVLPMFYLELISGLRKGELVALQWADLDIENKTISVSKQAGRNSAGEPDITRPKTENSIRKISIPQDAVDLLIAEHQKHPSNPWMFPSPKTGEMYHPDSVVNIHKKILKDAGFPVGQPRRGLDGRGSGQPALHYDRAENNAGLQQSGHAGGRLRHQPAPLGALCPAYLRGFRCFALAAPRRPAHSGRRPDRRRADAQGRDRYDAQAGGAGHCPQPGF